MTRNRVTARGFLRQTGRALLLRCPRCGTGGILQNWFRLKRECPTCGLELDRGESDYWFGGYAVNFVAAELVVVGVLDRDGGGELAGSAVGGGAVRGRGARGAAPGGSSIARSVSRG